MGCIGWVAGQRQTAGTLGPIWIERIGAGKDPSQFLTLPPFLIASILGRTGPSIIVTTATVLADPQIFLAVAIDALPPPDLICPNDGRRMPRHQRR